MQHYEIIINLEGEVVSCWDVTEYIDDSTLTFNRVLKEHHISDESKTLLLICSQETTFTELINKGFTVNTEGSSKYLVINLFDITRVSQALSKSLILDITSVNSLEIRDEIIISPASFGGSDMPVITKTYYDLLDSRRNLYLPLYYEENLNSYALCYISKKVSYECAILKNSLEALDFEANRKSFCNKDILPFTRDLRTHDLCDNTEWKYGTSNSLYVLQPEAGKMFRAKRFLIKVDKDLNLSTGQDLVCNLWKSINESVPAYVAGTKTEFGTPLFNPAEGVMSGWMKQTEGEGIAQENELWIYLTYNVELGQAVPLYCVTCFTYKSLKDLRMKADESYVGNLLNALFDYDKANVQINCLSSKNERLEFYIKNDIPYTSPNNEFCTVSCLLEFYDEF